MTNRHTDVCGNGYAESRRNRPPMPHFPCKNAPRIKEAFLSIPYGYFPYVLNLSDALQDHLGNNGGADVGTDEDDYTHQNDAPAALGEDIEILADGNARISQDRGAELEEPYILNGRIDKIGSREARIGQNTSEGDHIGYAGDLSRKDAAHPHADESDGDEDTHTRNRLHKIILGAYGICHEGHHACNNKNLKYFCQFHFVPSSSFASATSHSSRFGGASPYLIR